MYVFCCQICIFRNVIIRCDSLLRQNATAAAKSLQSCPTLCDPIDGSPLGSPVPGILQARTLEWVAISFSSAWKWKVKVKSLSHVRLFVTPWTAAYQAPLSIEFSRQEYWSEVPLPSPRMVLGERRKKLEMKVDWDFGATAEINIGGSFAYTRGCSQKATVAKIIKTGFPTGRAQSVRICWSGYGYQGRMCPVLWVMKKICLRRPQVLFKS